MVNSTKTRCLQCGAAVNAEAQFCERCGSAVARGPMPRSAQETWEDEIENPTVPEMKLPRVRPVAPAPAYKFQPEQLVLVGIGGAALSGIIALLSALIVLSKGHTIGAGLCLIAAAFAFGLLALSGARKS